jgi:DNA-binding LacI/PurR family transcriptional regulator
MTNSSSKVKQPTIHDVARAAGIHKSTVSVALSGKGNLSASTRARVLAVARELGYEPNPLAQRLAHGQSDSRVCLISGGLDVGLATAKILMVQQALTAQGLEAPIYTFSDPGRGTGLPFAEQIELLRRQRPRALILSAQMMGQDAFQALERYQAGGGVVISYDLPVSLTCDQVVFDREDNAYQAARHLLERGHRRIGLGMSGAVPWQHGSAPAASAHRLSGFRRALEEWGVPLREEWLFANQTYETGGAEMARHFLALRERPTGVCIVNDYVALAFMAEVMRAGVRIPDDVSVVGHDNQPIAAYCPVPLTSATQPTGEIAQTVIDLLLARLASPADPPRMVTIRGEITLRQSVAQLPL